MITDAQLRFSQAQTLAVAAGTTLSTNVENLLSANRNIGRGQPMRFITTVDQAFAGGTSVQVQIIQSASANMSSPDVLASGPTVLDAQATASSKLLDLFCPDVSKQFVAVQYVTVGTHTAGAVSTHLVSDTDANNYPPAVTGY